MDDEEFKKSVNNFKESVKTCIQEKSQMFVYFDNHNAKEIAQIHKQGIKELQMEGIFDTEPIEKHVYQMTQLGNKKYTYVKSNNAYEHVDTFCLNMTEYGQKKFEEGLNKSLLPTPKQVTEYKTPRVYTSEAFVLDKKSKEDQILDLLKELKDEVTSLCYELKKLQTK